jgi:biopolymer transport protein ExbD
MARRSAAAAEAFEEEESEINLTPYLDIITTLVIFLIFSFQVIIEFRLINVFVPEAVGGAGAGATPESVPPVEAFVFVSDEGYRIAASNGASITVPKQNGSFDTKKLREELTTFKAGVLASGGLIGDNLTMTAAAEIPYDTVVEAMDAIRFDAKDKTLFPAVVLGAAAFEGAAAPAGGTP